MEIRFQGSKGPTDNIHSQLTAWPRPEPWELEESDTTLLTIFPVPPTTANGNSDPVTPGYQVSTWRLAYLEHRVLRGPAKEP
jgi:hypothetical protein